MALRAQSFPEHAANALLDGWGRALRRGWAPGIGYPKEWPLGKLYIPRRPGSIDLPPEEFDAVHREILALWSWRPKAAAALWAKYVWVGTVTEKRKQLAEAGYVFSQAGYTTAVREGMTWVVARCL